MLSNNMVYKLHHVGLVLLQYMITIEIMLEAQMNIVAIATVWEFLSGTFSPKWGNHSRLQFQSLCHDF